MRHNFKLISDSKDEKPLIVGRKSYKYELRQKWKNINVNGQQVNVLNINVVVIAVEGLIRDYLFVIRYPSGNYSEEKKNLIREQNAQLCKSIKTVKFHVPEDYETIKSSIKSIRDEQEDVLSLIHSNKRKFERAFEMTMNYLLKKSHSNTLDDETILKSLKELDITAKRYGLRYKDISDLFEILGKTEKGDTEKLTSRYQLLANEYTKWQRSPEAFVPVDLLFG